MADEKHVGRRTALLVCGLALLAAAVVPAVAHPATGSRTTVGTLENGVLAELNDIRVAHGLRPLRLSRPLAAAARQHTFEMLDDGYFEHDSANGDQFWQRLERYYPKGKNIWDVGENLIWSSPSLGAGTALRLWMDSAGHRKNILFPAWREIGIAAVHSDTSTGAYGGGAVTIITTDFGAR